MSAGMSRATSARPWALWVTGWDDTSSSPATRQPVQVIDSRDLARLVVQLLTDDRPGAFHAVGPAEPVTLSGLIGTCAQAAGTQVEIVPVPPETAPSLFPLIR